MLSHPVVLTNGSWHGAWAWTEVLPHLAAAGIVATPIEIEGLGGLRGFSPRARRSRPFDPAAFATEPSGVAGVTLDSATDALVDDVERAGAGEPVVIVAHSLGGLIVASAVERAPQLFQHVVYVSAMTPVVGMLASAYNALPEMADSLVVPNIVADPAVTGSFRGDFDGEDGHELARRTFYGDVPDELAERALSLLSSDIPAGIDGSVPATTERFGSVPRTWVLCTDDAALRPALQRRVIVELDSVSVEPTRVVELASAHSPFFSRPAELAGILAEAAQG